MLTALTVLAVRAAVADVEAFGGWSDLADAE
jgi:hypothetical protein